jgi:propanol-preferring alcohol dehydrogenase
MLLQRPAPEQPSPAAVEVAEIEVPEISASEVLLRVSVCGVCRTDLDIVQGRIVPPRYPVIPGHQVIGRVTRLGADVTGMREGDRLGVAWINSACGSCRWCRNGEENLCPSFRATGCDVNGGYAEYVSVPASFAHAIPAVLTDAEAAPLLCAGAIGLRSLRLTKLRPADPLGMTGFGASAHLVLQLARHLYPDSPVYVFARNSQEQAFARSLGAAWAGDTTDEPPAKMGAIIDTTPAWTPVVEALRHLLPGGRLVVNAIRKTSADQAELLRLDYASQLWLEREIKSVANVTRRDVREMLAIAAETELRPTIQELPLEQANDALGRLRDAATIRGATVLRVS